MDKFEADEAGELSPPRVERTHNYDAVTELVAERVEKSRGRMSAKRILPIARAAGYEGSARNFRRLVAQAKGLWRKEHHRGRRPAVWSPGEYLVIDWAEAAPGLFLFCAVLAFSRWRFVAFATDQRASTTLALIAEAFAAIGGVPARVLADRMACLKGGVVANVVIPTAERELLQPLPSLRLRIGAPSVIRNVDRLSCIRYASARYSVPTRLIGSSVSVVVDHGAVCIVEPATGVIVAEHELGAPGSASVLDDHYDGPRPVPSRGPRPKTAVEQQFCTGDDAQAFLVGAAAIGNTRLGSELEVLLGLGASHGNDALIAALRRAVAFKRFRAADVRSILAAGAGTPQPRPAGDALILDLPVAPTRSLDEQLRLQDTGSDHSRFSTFRDWLDGLSVRGGSICRVRAGESVYYMCKA